MGDTGLTKDRKRKPNKSGTVNKIISLFDIPRPNKKRDLQRTNSLPVSSKRPSISSLSNDISTLRADTQFSTGKVKKIKEEIEQKSKERDSNDSRMRRKGRSNRITSEATIILSTPETMAKDIDERLSLTVEVGSSDEPSEEAAGASFDIEEHEEVFESCESDEKDDNCNDLSEAFSDTLTEISAIDKTDCNSQDDSNSELYEENESFSSYVMIPSPHTTPEKIDKVVNSNLQTNTQSTSVQDSFQWWKHKSFVQINNDHLVPKLSEDSASVSESPLPNRKFIKNIQSARTTRRTGILQKASTVKELRKHFEGFREAAENGETENYRRSIIDEMDRELENMKLDGFKEDYGNLDDLEPEASFIYEDFESNDQDTILGDYCSQLLLERPSSEPDQDDFFGEMVFNEDLEQGSYYIEAFNAEGKELLICNIQIDRHSVDLSRFNEIKASRSNVINDDDRTLVLLGDPEGSLNSSKSGTESKRTTIYSTTSGESYDDEEMEATLRVYNTYSDAQRETYCDDRGVVRIERIGMYAEGPDLPNYVQTRNHYYINEISQNTEEENIDNEDNESEHYYESVRLEHEILFSIPEAKKNTLLYILDEMKATERKYVIDLHKVLTEYMLFVEQRYPQKVDVVFANMKQIYHLQVQFLEALEEAKDDVEKVCQVFIEFDDLFLLYPRYFRNTPKANAAVKELHFLLKEKQEKINDKLDLSAYLLTPLQRLGKYKLFLENITKHLEREQKPVGCAQMALEIIKKYMRRGNDAVAVASILHSPLHTKDYGSFIAREKFIMLKPKRMDVMVFLFDDVVVFTTEIPKNMEEFDYFQCIKMIDLRIATFEDTTLLHLTDFTKTKRRNSSKYTYILEAKTEKVKIHWKQQIEDILWKQMEKLKEKTLKEFNNGNKVPKKASRKKEQRAKSTGSSVFYIE